MAIVASVAAAALAATVFVGDPEVAKGCYEPAGKPGLLIEYTYPAYLRSPRWATKNLPDGTSEYTFTFENELDFGKNRGTLELYFRQDPAHSQPDRVVVAALGVYRLQSIPVVEPGKAAVIDCEKSRVEAPAMVKVDGRVLRLSFKTSDVGKGPCKAILFRFLPAEIGLDALADDLNSVQPIWFYRCREYRNGLFRALTIPTALKHPGGTAAG